MDVIGKFGENIIILNLITPNVPFGKIFTDFQESVTPLNPDRVLNMMVMPHTPAVISIPKTLLFCNQSIKKQFEY